MTSEDRRSGRVAALLVATVLAHACASAPPPALTLESMIHDAAASVVSVADQHAAIASAFAVAPGGWLVTNRHVATADPLYLLAADGSRHRLRRVVEDDENDLALLKVDDVALPTLELAEAPPRVGQTVVALGNPYGLGITATRGIVSALPGAIGQARLLQTDAALNPGNAGGPLLDGDGRVVGIVTSRGPVGSGVGFAVPADRIAALIRTRIPARPR